MHPRITWRPCPSQLRSRTWWRTGELNPDVLVAGQVCSRSCQRTHFNGSAGTARSLQPCCALTRFFGRQTHWSGTPDSNRDSHDPKSCGLNRFPSARRKAPVKNDRAGLSTGPRNENPRYYLTRGYGPSRALRVSTHAGFVACGILPNWIACIITQLHSK